MRRIGHRRRSGAVPSLAAPWRSRIVGRYLVAVTTSWHERDGRVHPLPVHVWLDIGGAGPVQVGAGDDGSLDVVAAPPYGPYDMGAQGKVRVETAQPAFPFTPHIGQDIVSIDDLGTRRFERPLGVVVGFASGAVAAANLGDELVVLPWPSPRWDAVGLSILD